VDLRRLRTGEKLAGGGGIALAAVTFLPWYAASASLTAWEAFSVLDLALALTAGMGVTVAALAVTRASPALPVSLSVVLVALALIVLAVTVYRLLDQPGDNSEVAVRTGAYLGAGCLALITFGAWRSVADEEAGGAETPEIPARPAPPAAGPDAAAGARRDPQPP